MDEQISTEYKVSLVGNQACFRLLTDEEIAELSELFTEVYANADETVVTEGDIVDSVFLIVSGTATVQHSWVDNGVIKVEKLAELGPEQAIGLSETGLYSLTGRRTATVIAKTDMVLLRMSVSLFNGFVLSHSHVSKVLHAAAAERNAEADSTE